MLQGIEAHADFQLTSQLSARARRSTTCAATLKRHGEPLPRIPPLRVRGGLRYQRNAFQAGGEIAGVAKQERVFGAETRPTAISC